jgi:hypothetical protein
MDNVWAAAKSALDRLSGEWLGKYSPASALMQQLVSAWQLARQLDQYVRFVWC